MLLNSADYLIEIGPQAGEQGGEVVFTGTVAEARRFCQQLNWGLLKWSQSDCGSKSATRGEQGVPSV